MEEGDSSSTMRKQSFADHKAEDAQMRNNLDSSGSLLITIILDDTNYLIWKRAIRIALKSKGKIQFIEGKSKTPSEDSEEYWIWERNDSMVFSWILNSISKDLIPSFIHSTTAKELWLNIEERFGTSSGPMLYQIQREINNHSQGNLSLKQHFGKLKTLWDEFEYHTAAMNITELKELYQLMQFLMSLHEGYDHVKNQILLMEPKPSVSKAYSMLLGIEFGMNTLNNISVNVEHITTMHTRLSNTRNKEILKQKQANDKTKLLCDYCKKKGH